MHRFALHNGRIHEAGDRLLSPGQVGLLNGWGVFSTLRVREGVLFAFERHFARMARDARLMRVPFPEHPRELQEPLLQLIQANEAWEATLRVAVVRNQGGMWEGPGSKPLYDVIAFTTGLNDWGDSVRLMLVPEGRHAASEFAGTKVLSWSQNLCWYERAHDKGFDEVIFLNERGELSECTSANLFLVRGQEAVTPPLRSGCLPGVTRALLLEEVRVPGITVRESILHPTDIERADGLFITSTTRELLPVREIEGYAVRSGQQVRDALQLAFAEYQRSYINQRLLQEGVVSSLEHFRR